MSNETLVTIDQETAWNLIPKKHCDYWYSFKLETSFSGATIEIRSQCFLTDILLESNAQYLTIIDYELDSQLLPHRN